MVLGIFKIPLQLSDQHVFIGQSVKVSNVLNTLTLKQIFWKTKTSLKKLEYRFLVETTKIESTSFPSKTALWEANVRTNTMATRKCTCHHFHSKLLCQKPMLRQIQWRLQNGAITKSGVLPVTTLFFWKICSSFRTS